MSKQTVKTTVREYDEAGRMTKETETVSEYDWSTWGTTYPTYPSYPYTYPGTITYTQGQNGYISPATS